ncbi:hypothetical protein ACOMHN_037485 [Nucella lapillus]
MPAPNPRVSVKTVECKWQRPGYARSKPTGVCEDREVQVAEARGQVMPAPNPRVSVKTVECKWQRPGYARSKPTGVCEDREVQVVEARLCPLQTHGCL